MIKVYDPSETNFSNNGIKNLKPQIAEITKVDNGDYYLELRDVIANIDYYQKGMIIRTSTPWGEQCFRCDNPTITNSKIDVKAWHISYDSKNYLIKDVNIVDKNCNYALDHVNSNTDITSPFIVSSDITTEVSSRIIRKSLYEVFQTFISADKYGGHWYRDNFNFSIKTSIGEDRGVVLADGKNITTMKVTEKWDNVVTKILPYTTNGEVAILLDNTYVSLNEDLYDIPFSKVVKFENELKKDDYSSDDEYVAESKKWLLQKAKAYLEENKYPQINYQVESNINNVSDVGDLIYVKHPKCRVNITTNVISVKYNCLTGRFIKIEFGNFQQDIRNLTSDINTIAKDEAKKVAQGENQVISTALEKATGDINSLLYDSYVIYNGDSIYVVDNLPKENATNVIRINSQGIGFSTSGINGTFNSAWSIDGTLNMQYINVINLTADLIRGGTLKLGGVNNNSGAIEVYDNSNKLISKLDKDGLIIYANNGDYVKLNSTDGFVGYNRNDEKIYWADGNSFKMKNAEIENEIKISGKIKIVPVSTNDNVGVGFVAIS